MTNEQLLAQIAELQALKAENEALKAAKNKPRDVSFKITEKGGLSVYGLGRFPVTLYKSQWTKLMDKAQEIQEFIVAHASELTEKPVVAKTIKQEEVA